VDVNTIRVRQLLLMLMLLLMMVSARGLLLTQVPAVPTLSQPCLCSLCLQQHAVCPVLHTVA
jgi:hypothetical protein